MKILSWNVNGLRAIHRKRNWHDILDTSADILCIQETKCREDQLSSDLKNPDGYYSYFSSHKTKKGYSGVATYTKKKPERVEYGMGIERFDDEGRIVTLFFKEFILLNIYFPNGGGGPERLAYKLDFYDAFLGHVENLRKENTRIIFCGDVNTAHEEIDLARPKENETHTGFLPEERAWIDEVVAHGYVDVFRHFYPHKTDVYTYWDMKTRARERNVGWRIDYFFATQGALKNVTGIEILTGVQGSDHCPLAINYKVEPLP